MPKQRSPDREKAEQLYLESSGKLKLKDIADSLNLPEGTIRGWKNKDHWDYKLNGTFQSKNTERSETKRRDKKSERQLKVISIEDVDLTEKQRLFCLYYIKDFNATMAAIKAGYSPDTARQMGYENLTKPYIANEIKRLKGRAIDELFIDTIDVLRKYVEIAFSDATDYLKFGQRDVQVMGPFGPLYVGKGKNKKPLMKTVNFVDFKESAALDGTIISEVKQGRDGVSIKFEDRMKALDKLAKYFDLFPDKFKRRIEEEKLKLDKEKFEHEKAGDKNNTKPVKIKVTLVDDDD